MKQSFALLLLFCFGFSYGQSNLKFEKDTIDLGTIVLEMDSAEHEKQKIITLDFPYVNVGNEPLIITSATSAGYGNADYPKTPILPKQKGIIKATFTRFKYTGYMKKGEDLRPFCTSIVIQGNFPGGQKSICIKGYVTRKK